MNTRQVYEQLLKEIQLPKMIRLDERKVQPLLTDPYEAAYRTVKECPSYQKLRGGERIALTAGSRDICNITLILKGVIQALREKGAKPFILAAMGSHGGATAEGQLQVIAHYGITEESMGVPVMATMETVEIGQTDLGERVHLDKLAYGADYIMPVGRIKAHTEFRGKVESGLMKMLVIGLGNQYGACLCHKLGFPKMGDSLWRFGNVILRNAKVLMGVAIVENGEHKTALVEAVPAEKIPQREPELLEYSKSLLPRIPYRDIDVLLVSEFGKDLSGAGMDPNVSGRSGTMGELWPYPEKIGVFDITPASEGNAAGIGMGDAITRRMYEQLNLMPMYINSLTCRDSVGYRIPVVMDTEELVLKYLIHMCIRRDATIRPYVVWIRNTANLKKIYVSEALYQDCPMEEGYIKASEPAELKITESGRLYVGSEPDANFE